MKKIGLILFLVHLCVWSAAQEQVEKNFVSKFSADITEKKSQEIDILRALYSLNKNIQKLVREKSSLEKETSYLEASLDPLNQEIHQTSERINEQRRHLAKRIRAMGTMTGPGWFKFILSSQSAVDLDRNIRLLSLVSQRDREIVRQYQGDLKSLQVKKEKLEARKELILQKSAKLKRQEVKLLAEVSRKNKILNRVKKQNLFTQKKLEALKGTASYQLYQDASVIDLFTRPAFAEKKGELLRPVKAGALIKNYGIERSSEHPYILHNRGVFLATERGTSVQATSDGKVLFAGALSGLGQTLVLDHGDHYYSVYSNLDQIPVQSGQAVVMGDVVGKTGYSALNESAGLYFEIRHFSEAYNPAQWVKGL